MSEPKTLILNNLQIDQKLNRMAYEILENHYDEKELIFVGVAERGLILAKRIAEKITGIGKIKAAVFSLNLDKKNPLKTMPVTNLTQAVAKGKIVFLVDDVLNTGKTLMFAANHLLSFDLKGLKTVILVNRRHRLFPIRADIVGLTLATTLKEHIEVNFGNSQTGVYLI